MTQMIFVAMRLRACLDVMAQTDVILTPDQRVRVFVSSTLEELAAERAAARRAIRRLHLAPVWYESGAQPHPPRSMYQVYRPRPRCEQVVLLGADPDRPE